MKLSHCPCNYSYDIIFNNCLVAAVLLPRLIIPQMNRGHQATNKVSYSYQLCSLTSEPKALGAGFQSISTAFRHTRVEDYNWNYLDQHICGHSDFEELGEVSNYKERQCSP